ncbi:MAG: ASCH domain-containing protein [Chitinophagaceae bacterium]
MLFKDAHLKQIKSGTINLAFRKWHKPSVKAGTLIHTSVGLIEVKRITVILETEITETNAIKAGFASRDQLLQTFKRNSNGAIYRIEIGYYSEDPRIELREQTILSEQEYDTIFQKLKKLDRLSKKGDWTKKVLMAIMEHPNLHAIGISQLTGFDKEWLKLNIRKLKNLGLTISHTVGYELSPKGKVIVTKL